MVKWQDEHTVVELVVETDFFNMIWVEIVVLYSSYKMMTSTFDNESHPMSHNYDA